MGLWVSRSYYRVIDMITLALDTSTRIGSCAVLRGDDVMAEVPGTAERSHAERLPADLMTALDRGGVGLADVDVFTVATGPGSFTGLRVGIATMQGLALAAGRPLVGVSVLDALAHAAAHATPRAHVATWLDAWRDEVFAALYDGVREMEAPSVERPATILARLQGRPTVFIGDGAVVHQQQIARTMGVHGELAAPLDPPLAGIIGRLARREVAAGRRPGPAEIQPLYVRRPDVELARDARVER
jgi:tRNA threonylcarbamoyladenosine biosynthesis protein TsaB